MPRAVATAAVSMQHTGFCVLGVQIDLRVRFCLGSTAIVVQSRAIAIATRMPASSAATGALQTRLAWAIATVHIMDIAEAGRIARMCWVERQS